MGPVVEPDVGALEKGNADEPSVGAYRRSSTTASDEVALDKIEDAII
jgi:hypothetical protein